MYRKLFFLCLLLINQKYFSQSFDMEYDNSKFSLDSLGVFEFDLEFRESLQIFNHGIQKPDFKNYSFTGTSFFITRVIDHNLGFIDCSDYNNQITIKPYIVKKKLVSNNDFRYRFQDKLDLELVKSFIDKTNEWLNKNTEFKINYLNDSLFYIDEKNFNKNILFRNHLKNITSISDFNFTTGAGLYLVPIIAEISSLEKEYYHIELHFYENENLLFFTSISAHINNQNHVQYKKTNDENIYMQIIESLFHQIYLE